MNSLNSKQKASFCNYILIIAAVLLLFVSSLRHSYGSEDKWPGVDESVVEKYAEEQGRGAVDPLVNTDQGDLLLFVFLLAGAAGGFIGGYYWRMLIAEEKPDKK